MKYSPYSFSKISTHKQCNRKFYYNYIKKAPKSKIDLTPMLKGGAIHSILENYPIESKHKLAPKYQYIADEFIKSTLGEKYLSQNSIREFNFGITEDLIPCEYKDKKAMLRGSVDYICTIDDVLHLIDWKSGKLKAEKWQSYDQLMFYAIYFFIRYPKINTIKISYVYVEHPGEENSMVLQRKYFDNYKNDLVTSIKNIENDESFNKNETKLCDWCEFKTHCENDTESL